MESSERDRTGDWLLPENARPPLLSELEGRVDEALATARASEAAVERVGASALEAANQARRAADVAERAASTALEIQVQSEEAMRRAAPMAPGPIPSPMAATEGGEPQAPLKEGDEDGLRRFSERADRVYRRLQKLQRVPLRPGGRSNRQPAR